MPTAEQIKSLIKSHFENDRERFTTIALQVASHEARQGHTMVAHEIRDLVDKSRSQCRRASIIPLRRELADLVQADDSEARLSQLILSDSAHKRIHRIINEYRQQDKLKKHGLQNRRKLLLAGPPGTGKTLTASVLAGELHLPLFTILMHRMVTKYMGETSAKLRQIFDIMEQHKGVFLFDEFDAIGAERGKDNDVGEMRRVLNSYLQFIENDASDSLIIAATNNPRLLDQALFRRFDDVLHYQLPTSKQAAELIQNNLAGFLPSGFSLESTVCKALDLSHAEITQACNDAIKETILSDKTTVSEQMLHDMLMDRKSAYQKNAEK